MAIQRSLKITLFAGIVTAAIAGLFLLSTLLLCGLLRENSWCRWWPHFSITEITALIRSFGFWGVGASIGLMVIHSFVPFPAEFIAIANGMIYGPLWGTVITWVGAMIGAFSAFGLVRSLGRPFVERMVTKKKGQKIEEWTARYGGEMVLISRFFPVISFNLINYVAGLTGISWWTFTWTTGLGILPMTLLMVVLGEQIKNLPWWVWLLLLVIGLAMLLLARRIFHFDSIVRENSRREIKKIPPLTNERR
ncbi:MAG: TVP38/TMEM64 family protein [Deltaproteobacteria bacterium]|nr:TVP38/TMEM64 family protein [Deltaproteobacteria bacterium]